MMVKIQPLEGIISSKQAVPDKYEHSESKFNFPDSTFVVSRDNDGNVLSCYGDESWDLSPYKSVPNEYAIINFNKNISKEEQVLEAKKMVFLLMTYAEGKKSSSYSVSTLRAYFGKTIIPLSQHAIHLGISVQEILSNNKKIKEYIDQHCINRERIIQFSSLLTFLDRLDNGITGIDFKRETEVFKYLVYLRGRIKTKHKTEVIPTRILSESISQRWKQIDDIEKNLNGIVGFLRRFLESDLYAETDIMHRRRIRRNEVYGTSWSDAVSKHELSTLFAKYNISRRSQFRTFLRDVRGTCKHLIHAYSGMRDSEVQSLNNFCLDKSDTRFIRLVGKTTKSEGTPKTEKWTTSKEIEQVVNILRQMNKVIADDYNYPLEKLPLFVKTSLFYGGKKEGKVDNWNAARFAPTECLSLDSSSMTIQENDLQELYDIDYLRDWKNEEKFKVGKQWYFQFHQYRRSLAVYSIQSGLVSLGALQKQFKHLFRDITAYYASGASFAKNHFGQEINDIRSEIQALVYIKNVIFSDEKLFGAHGTLVEKNIKEKIQDKRKYIMHNREHTIKQVEKGLISYRDTALGGCISVEPCNTILTRSIIGCFGCEGAVLKSSKYDITIEKEKRFIAQLDSSSIEFRTEMEDLRELEKQKKLLGDKNE